MSDIHVVPINDLRAHVETRDCWCAPRLVGDLFPDADVVLHAAAVVVVHTSADGRELVEQHGIN